MNCRQRTKRPSKLPKVFSFVTNSSVADCKLIFRPSNRWIQYLIVFTMNCVFAVDNEEQYQLTCARMTALREAHCLQATLSQNKHVVWISHYACLHHPDSNFFGIIYELLTAGREVECARARSPRATRHQAGGSTAWATAAAGRWNSGTRYSEHIKYVLRILMKISFRF